MATTSNYGLYKPAVDETGWGGAVDTNLDTIDTTLASLQSQVYTKESTSHKGTSNGYAGLDVNSHVPATQLGSGTPNGTKYLRDDNTWQTVTSGSGDVSGPSSSTVGHVATYSNTAGTQIADGGSYVPEDLLSAASSSTPAFNWSNSRTWDNVMTSDITPSFSGGFSGMHGVLVLVQDATGGRKATWPSNVKGFPQPDPDSSTVTTYFFIVRGTNYYCCGSIGGM
jgi:hypothetical protein